MKVVKGWAWAIYTMKRSDLLHFLLLCCLQSRTPSLIFEHVNNTDFKVVFFLHFDSYFSSSIAYSSM